MAQVTIGNSFGWLRVNIGTLALPPPGKLQHLNLIFKAKINRWKAGFAISNSSAGEGYNSRTRSGKKTWKLSHDSHGWKDKPVQSRS